MKGHNTIRKNTARERAWKVMRGMRSFTAADICTVADVPGDNIKHWIQCLVHAGYLRITGKKKQEGRPGLENVYLLVKNTGPKPPVQKDLRFIFDPNTGEYWNENPECVATIIVGAIPAGRPVLDPDTGRGNASPLQNALTGRIKLSDVPKLLCPRKKVTHVD